MPDSVPPVASLLVLWDVDYTLADTDGVGRLGYELAFAEMFGTKLAVFADLSGTARPQMASMAGRTDHAISLEVLRLAGVPDPASVVPAFVQTLARQAPAVAALARTHGRALPGAADALAALAVTQHLQVVQSVLTGNVRPMAEVKLAAVGLLEHLDLDAGAYGDVSGQRADLVELARRSAAERYLADFAGQATVVVGDTPFDVEAALLTGARAVGVATGRFSGPQLAAAGAHAVLADLSDTGQVLAAILSG
jgi:phosphoglycolate phosphatase